MDKPNLVQVAIIDYKMSNLFSVNRACESVGMIPNITTDKDVIENADAVILPGVGAFGAAMDNLRKLDLIEPIIEFTVKGKPFMGICLGMQLLMTQSEEFGIHKGLDIIKGSVLRFPSKDGKGRKHKVPQVGWNRIARPSFAQDDYWEKTPLRDIREGEYMYFVHSYYVKPDSADNTLTVTDYAVEYASSIIKDNIYGFQFHPEKSGKRGLEIYKNFKELVQHWRTYNGA